MIVMSTIAAGSRLDTVQMRLEALRDHFDTYFDRGWLAMLIDDLPLESSLVRQIRAMLAISAVYPENLREIAYGVQRIEELVTELRRHLLPVLRDRLGVSGFSRVRGAAIDDRVYRQFLCLTFPHNLERLEALNDALSDAVGPAA